MQKFVISVKKNLKIDMIKIKIIVKLGTTVITQGNREVQRNLKYSLFR